MALGKKGSYQRAITQFGEVVRIDPGEVKAYYNTGIAYARLGNLEQAIASLTAALRIDPGYEPARRRLEEWQQKKVGAEK